MKLRLSTRCAPSCKLCVDELELSDSVTTSAAVRERLEHAAATGCQVIHLITGESFGPSLVEAVRAVAERKLRAVLIANGRAVGTNERLQLLSAAGLKFLYIKMYGATAETHDARVGRDGAWKHSVALMATMMASERLSHLHVGIHVALSKETAGELPRILQLAGRLAVREVLVWDAPRPELALEAAEVLSAIDKGWLVAGRAGVALRVEGFERVRHVALPAAPMAVHCDTSLVDLLRQGFPLPSARAGLRAIGENGRSCSPDGIALSDLGFELAARGYAFVDLPACLGGVPATRAPERAPGIKTDACRACPVDACCPGAPTELDGLPGLREVLRPLEHWRTMGEHPRVLVLASVIRESMQGTTYFSLARAMAARGAYVDIVSPWAIHLAIPSTFAERQPRQIPKEGSKVDEFVARGDLAPYDLIVAPDLMTGHALLRSGRLPATARLTVIDFHMLGGMNDWVRDWVGPSRRPEEGGWWPSERATLCSGFPGYVHLYMRYGIPLRQVAWRPFALDNGVFGPGPPPTTCTAIISGGNHLRDLDTLLAAAAQLVGRVRPIDLYSDGPPLEGKANIRFNGVAPPEIFYSALARSRFVIVPLKEDVNCAAGITSIVAALMLGRPVIASSTASSRDYLRDGVDGLLVPPGDASALAAAIERLETDESLLAALAQGAQEAASRLSTDCWAEELLYGSQTWAESAWMWQRIIAPVLGNPR